MTGLDARGLPVGYPFRPDLEVTPRDVKARIESVLLVDCRTPQEAAAARIQGAVLVPLDEFAGKAEWLVDEAGNRSIVIHCHMGGRSMKAALFLRGQGIDAKSMAGGIDAWSLDVDPSVPRY